MTKNIEKRLDEIEKRFDKAENNVESVSKKMDLLLKMSRREVIEDTLEKTDKSFDEIQNNVMKDLFAFFFIFYSAFLTGLYINGNYVSLGIQTAIFFSLILWSLKSINKHKTQMIKSPAYREAIRLRDEL